MKNRYLFKSLYGTKTRRGRYRFIYAVVENDSPVCFRQGSRHSTLPPGSVRLLDGLTKTEADVWEWFFSLAFGLDCGHELPALRRKKHRDAVQRRRREREAIRLSRPTRMPRWLLKEINQQVYYHCTKGWVVRQGGTLTLVDSRQAGLTLLGEL